MYKIKQNWNLVVKKASLSAIINKIQLTLAIKKVRCVKFTNSYDNSTLLKADNNTEDPESLITYDVEPKININTKGEGKITSYPV